MGNFCEGEVWFVEFPLEENPNQTINRPVVVLDEDNLGVFRQNYETCGKK